MPWLPSNDKWYRLDKVNVLGLFAISVHKLLRLLEIYQYLKYRALFIDKCAAIHDMTKGIDTREINIQKSKVEIHGTLVEQVSEFVC
jgi:hypothetical protein